jgi:hypothetical protein
LLQAIKTHNQVVRELRFSHGGQDEIIKRGGVMGYPDLPSNRITHHHEKKFNTKIKTYVSTQLPK